MFVTRFLAEIFCLLGYANNTTCDITLHNDIWKSFNYFEVARVLHINEEA